MEHEDRMKVSIIIPTKNRAEDLRQTLYSVAIQTRTPDEIIVVDQSSTSSLYKSDLPETITYIHDPSISGLTAARNLAMDLATGDIWFFLDDDVILEPQYLEELLRVYSPEVDGVSGIITNYTLPPLSRRLFESIFMKGSFHDDRQGIYWAAERLRFQCPRRVRQFTGAVMSFRAAAVGTLRFDANLKGGCLAEDIDFCARLRPGAVLLIAPKARLFHKRSDIGRPTTHWLDAHAQSSTYMRLRNWHRGWKDDLCFAWLQIGYALMASVGSIKRRSLGPFRAWAHGAARGRYFAGATLMA
jgi:glycosyltransferase involved in cell wall biosynthesis